MHMLICAIEILNIIISSSSSSSSWKWYINYAITHTRFQFNEYLSVVIEYAFLLVTTLDLLKKISGLFRDSTYI